MNIISLFFIAVLWFTFFLSGCSEKDDNENSYDNIEIHFTTYPALDNPVIYRVFTIDQGITVFDSAPTSKKFSLTVPCKKNKLYVKTGENTYHDKFIQRTVNLDVGLSTFIDLSEFSENGKCTKQSIDVFLTPYTTLLSEFIKNKVGKVGIIGISSQDIQSNTVAFNKLFTGAEEYINPSLISPFKFDIEIDSLASHGLFSDAIINAIHQSGFTETLRAMVSALLSDGQFTWKHKLMLLNGVYETVSQHQGKEQFLSILENIDDLILSDGKKANDEQRFFDSYQSENIKINTLFHVKNGLDNDLIVSTLLDNTTKNEIIYCSDALQCKNMTFHVKEKQVKVINETNRIDEIIVVAVTDNVSIYRKFYIKINQVEEDDTLQEKNKHVYLLGDTEKIVLGDYDSFDIISKDKAVSVTGSQIMVNEQGVFNLDVKKNGKIIGQINILRYKGSSFELLKNHFDGVARFVDDNMLNDLGFYRLRRQPDKTSIMTLLATSADYDDLQDQLSILLKIQNLIINDIEGVSLDDLKNLKFLEGVNDAYFDEYISSIKALEYNTLIEIYQLNQLISAVNAAGQATISYEGLLAVNPIKDAIIEARSLANPGKVIATTGTDSEGRFTLFLPSTLNAVILASIGGEYVDQATGKIVYMENRQLHSVVSHLVAGSPLIIDPLTEVGYRFVLRTMGIDEGDNRPLIKLATSREANKKVAHFFFNTSESTLVSSVQPIFFNQAAESDIKQAAARQLDRALVLNTLSYIGNGDYPSSGISEIVDVIASGSMDKKKHYKQTFAAAAFGFLKNSALNASSTVSISQPPKIINYFSADAKDNVLDQFGESTSALENLKLWKKEERPLTINLLKKIAGLFDVTENNLTYYQQHFNHLSENELLIPANLNAIIERVNTSQDNLSLLRQAIKQKVESAITFNLLEKIFPFDQLVEKTHLAQYQKYLTDDVLFPELGDANFNTLQQTMVSINNHVKSLVILREAANSVFPFAMNQVDASVFNHILGLNNVNSNNIDYYKNYIRDPSMLDEKMSVHIDIKHLDTAFDRLNIEAAFIRNYYQVNQEKNKNRGRRSEFTAQSSSESAELMHDLDIALLSKFTEIAPLMMESNHHYYKKYLMDGHVLAVEDAVSPNLVKSAIEKINHHAMGIDTLYDYVEKQSLDLEKLLESIKPIINRDTVFLEDRKLLYVQFLNNDGFVSGEDNKESRLFRTFEGINQHLDSIERLQKSDNLNDDNIIRFLLPIFSMPALVEALSNEYLNLFHTHNMAEYVTVNDTTFLRYRIENINRQFVVDDVKFSLQKHENIDSETAQLLQSFDGFDAGNIVAYENYLLNAIDFVAHEPSKTALSDDSTTLIHLKSDTNKLFDVLQVTGAQAIQTAGGEASASTQTLYFYKEDASSLPGYAGDSWPYVYVRDNVIVDDSVSANLSVNDDNLLLINGKPVYQYRHNRDVLGTMVVSAAWPVINRDGGSVESIKEIDRRLVTLSKVNNGLLNKALSLINHQETSLSQLKESILSGTEITIKMLDSMFSLNNLNIKNANLYELHLKDPAYLDFADNIDVQQLDVAIAKINALVGTG